MHKQHGLSMWVFFTWCALAMLVAWLGYQLVPAYIEYSSIMHTARQITLDSQTNPESSEFSSIPAIRERFRNQANVGYFTVPENLKIEKEGGRVVITFKYEKRVKLVGNAYLVLEFSGNSRT
ncbi:MAG: DUF4845 domain-containing protein [Betaproteobacteria bacterium]|nr:DUF4845 domain-containing protein [Betaproteobacteria bacterium]